MCASLFASFLKKNIVVRKIKTYRCFVKYYPYQKYFTLSTIRNMCTAVAQ